MKDAAQRGRIDGAVQPAGCSVPENDPCMTSEHRITAWWVRLGVDFEEGGHRSARRNPLKSGWGRLKLNSHTTFVVEVERVINFQRVQHSKSIQIVAHPDINPVQTGFPFGASHTRRRVRAVSFGPSRSGRLITNSVYAWVSEWHICISEFPQETRFNASRIHEFKNCNKTVILETATCFLIFFCVIPGCHFPTNSSLYRKIHWLTREFRVKFRAKYRYRTWGKADY